MTSSNFFSIKGIVLENGNIDSSGNTTVPVGSHPRILCEINSTSIISIICSASDSSTCQRSSESTFGPSFIFFNVTSTIPGTINYTINVKTDSSTMSQSIPITYGNNGNNNVNINHNNPVNNQSSSINNSTKITHETPILNSDGSYSTIITVKMTTDQIVTDVALFDWETGISISQHVSPDRSSDHTYIFNFPVKNINSTKTSVYIVLVKLNNNSEPIQFKTFIDWSEKTSQGSSADQSVSVSTKRALQIVGIIAGITIVGLIGYLIYKKFLKKE
jgi:hypothetical protein